MSPVQTYTYPVRAYHTDAEGRLFVHQLVNFLQDAAHNHADSLGFGQQQLVQENLFWVLSRLSVEIGPLPRQGEELCLSTWVKSIRGSVSEREFVLAKDGRVVARASSLWFCLAAGTHKPCRLPVHYAELMPVKPEYATTRGAEKVKAPVEEGNKKGITVTARYTDIDTVDHINNATYVRWLTDGLYAAGYRPHQISRLAINYLSEGFLGEEYRVTEAAILSGKHLHEVVNTASGRVICRAVTCWQA